MSQQLQLATLKMIDQLPCPIPGCHHSRTDTNQHFLSKSTLLGHLNHDDHQATFHFADQSICTIVDIYSCAQQSCPTAPTCFFRSLNKLTQHNALHHPSSPTQSPPTTDQPPLIPTTPLDIGTSIFYTDSKNGYHNLWHLGIPFILQNTNHHPPRLQNHMAPPPQTPQLLKLPPPTSPHYPSHHQHIYTHHQLHPFLVDPLPP